MVSSVTFHAKHSTKEWMFLEFNDGEQRNYSKNNLINVYVCMLYIWFTSLSSFVWKLYIKPDADGSSGNSIHVLWGKHGAVLFLPKLYTRTIFRDGVG